METSTRLQENISAMVDNELAPFEVELTLAALAEPDSQAAWHVYHLIRDTLRAQPAPAPAPGFAARLAERLAAEELPGRPVDAPGDHPTPTAALLR